MKTNPIRRNENIVRLSHDHHAGLLFCWKIRQGLNIQTDLGRILNYVRYFWTTHLEPHFREEETWLFVLPEDAGIIRATNEHRQIGILVNAILSGLSADAPRLLEALADTVDKHIRFEERELFPHLEKQLTKPQLESIGNQIKENPHLPDTWQDEFWKQTTRSRGAF